MHRDIRRFVNYHGQMPSDFTLSLKAGKVDEDGNVDGGQYGAIDTFCVGMPMYSTDGKMLGRLELTLFDYLSYSDQTEEGMPIPVERWRIKDYTGPTTEVLTYYQAKEMGLIRKD